MPEKLTRDVIESYLHCKYKAHLKLDGRMGTRSDHEALLLDARDALQQKVIGKLIASVPTNNIEHDVVLTKSVLNRGTMYLLNARFEDDEMQLTFDGLKRVSGGSGLGDFHYIPFLYCDHRNIRKEQRALLDVLGLVLSRLQDRFPQVGIAWFGEACQSTRVCLTSDIRKVSRLLAGIRNVRGSAAPPQLILNDHCCACEFRDICHAQAVREDNISLLRGLGEKEIGNYARKGILTVTQLAHMFRPRRKGKRAPSKNKRRQHSLQALAIRDKRVYVLGNPQLPETVVRIFLDVEGDPDQGSFYLVGLIVSRGDQTEAHSFWSDSSDGEAGMFDGFLSVLSRFSDFRVYCYGAYEKAFLTKMRSQTARTDIVDRALDGLVNILGVIYEHFYFPTFSNGLKDVGAFLGSTWSDPTSSGIQSIVWRRSWEACHDDGWKEKLVNYNQEDCRALRSVTEFLYAAIAESKGTEQLRRNGGNTLAASVEELDRMRAAIPWGNVNWSDPNFTQINRCAYFDYQQQRVFVRTDKKLGRRLKGVKKNWSYPNRKLRIGSEIEIVDDTCPNCESTDLVRWTKGRRSPGLIPRPRRTMDLILTSGGIRRRVTQFRTKVHECRKCGAVFVPERFQRLAAHGHGLTRWSMYEHVEHRISLRILSEMLHEFFGLSVPTTVVYSFKSLLAEYYQTGYQQLFQGILRGPVLHVDETEVKLRTGKAYVWVFASLQSAVFMCRPNREGEFLSDLLADFRGVLVSDFYSAYDSIRVPQQKCLIHLMRDMNQELLNNPYDKELRSVTEPFGRLLRDIVATVDSRGLKRQYMKKHGRSVEIYFHTLDEQSFRSDAAEMLKERLLRNRDKLFTFLSHDGVPWNNNNAENAIKRFAFYRENTVGIMKEAGLQDYLTLLSLCHTCRYRGVSFLKFLLSGETDVDAFCCGGKRRPRSPEIQMYPRGYIPPYFVKLRSKRRQAKGDVNRMSDGPPDGEKSVIE